MVSPSFLKDIKPSSTDFASHLELSRLSQSCKIKKTNEIPFKKKDFHQTGRIST